MYRWDDGPPLNSVLPVSVEFCDKKDKLDVYNVCKSGLEKSGMVVTEDARSGKLFDQFQNLLKNAAYAYVPTHFTFLDLV